MKRFRIFSILFAISIFLSFYVMGDSHAFAQCVFGPEVLMSEVDGEFSNEPDVATDGKYVHVVWQDHQDLQGTSMGSRIFYKRSRDGGATWESIKAITPKNIDGDFHDPHIAVNGKNIHVVFIDIAIVGVDMISSVYYVRSWNNGNSWSKPVMLNMAGWGSYEAWYPDVCVSGDTVHVVWVDDREANDDFQIYYKRSIDNGKKWDDGDENPLNDNADSSKKISLGSGDFLYPSIHAFGDKIHVVWQWEWEKVYYAGSPDNGDAWSEPLLLVNEGARYPDIRAVEDTVHVVWEDDRHLVEEECNSEIYYARSLDGGITWEPEVRLTGMSMWSVSPKIDLRGSEIAIVWKDERDSPLDCGVIGPMPLGEIYYARSMDGGTTWDDGDTDPSNDNADHTRRVSEIDESGGHGKAVAVGENATHFVFDDTRYDAPDPSNIFIKDVFYRQFSCQ